jgi:thymidylate synthase (FAD)
MKVVEPSFKILYPKLFNSDNSVSDDWNTVLKTIEAVGRVAYKSEHKITEDSYVFFIEKLISNQHLAVLEFGDMIVQFVTDRGVSHELVRHRLCSFVQESTRYCNYASDKFDGELTFIQPTHEKNDAGAWQYICREAERAYLDLVLTKGWTPQQARSVLPNSLKTEIVVKANFREWMHIFKLRAISKAAHPDMRRLMVPLYEHVRSIAPMVFDMGDVE